jgi:hypothetical protein
MPSTWTLPQPWNASTAALVAPQLSRFHLPVTQSSPCVQPRSLGWLCRQDTPSCVIAPLWVRGLSPRRSPLCESHGPGAGRPIQSTTARFKSTVTFRTFYLGGPTRNERVEALPSRYSRPHWRHDPRCSCPAQNDHTKDVMCSHHVGPMCSAGGGWPSACGAQQHGRAVRRRLGRHRDGYSVSEVCPGPCGEPPPLLHEGQITLSSP